MHDLNAHCLINRLARELEVLSTFKVGKSYMYDTDAEHIGILSGQM